MDSARCLWENPYVRSPGVTCRHCRVFLIYPAARLDELISSSQGPSRSCAALLKCHGARQQKGGIRLDGPEHLANRATVPAPSWFRVHPGQSRLITVLQYTDEPRMPPAGKLPDSAIDALGNG